MCLLIQHSTLHVATKAIYIRIMLSLSLYLFIFHDNAKLCTIFSICLLYNCKYQYIGLCKNATQQCCCSWIVKYIRGIPKNFPKPHCTAPCIGVLWPSTRCTTQAVNHPRILYNGTGQLSQSRWWRSGLNSQSWFLDAGVWLPVNWHEWMNRKHNSNSWEEHRRF